MKVKDLDTILGLSIEELKRASKRYALGVVVLYAMDIAAIIGATVYMYYRDVQYPVYGIVLAMVCFLANFVVYYMLKPELNLLYKFYKKNREQFVLGKCYHVTWQDLRDALLKVGVSVKPDTSMEELRLMLLSSSRASLRNAYLVMKQLSRYEVESDNFRCLIVERGKKQYFVGFAPEVNKEDEVNEHHHSGSVEGSPSESGD